MTDRHRCLVLLLASLSSASQAAAPPRPAQFRWLQPLAEMAAAVETIVAVDLDEDVFDGARDDLADLRLFDAEDRQIPYLLEAATEARRRLQLRDCPLQVVAFNERPDNVFEIVLQRPQKVAAPSQLTVVTPIKNFEKRVTVLGGDGLGQWETLAERQPIFDYSRFFDARDTRVDFPARDYAQYLVRVENVTDLASSPAVEFTRQLSGQEIVDTAKGIIERRDFRIDRLVFATEVVVDQVAAVRHTNYPVGELTTTIDERQRRTEVRFSLPNVPFDRLAIDTPDRNFHRQAELQVRIASTTNPWRTVARGALAKIAFAAHVRTELALEFAETRGRQYRLLIDNGDNPPVNITAVTAAGPVYRLRFMGKPGSHYRLFYGHDQLRQPVYDTATVLGALAHNNQPTRLKLAPRQPNPAFAAPPRSLAAWLESKTTLAILAALVVGVLAWGVYYAVKHIDSLP